MKEYAVDFAYYKWDMLIYTIDWVKCKDVKNVQKVLERKYGTVHIQDIREHTRNWI